MFAKIKVAFGYWLMWILVFQLSRLGFLMYNFQETRNFPVTRLIKTFLYGLRMDVSMASYLVLPVCILLLMAIFIPYFTKAYLYTAYTAIILLPVLLIIFCDLPAYKAWGNRLDATPLKYLSSPKEAWASVSNLPLLWILVFFLLTYFLVLRSFQRYFSNTIDLRVHQGRKYLQTLFMIFFTGALVVPLRGGIQLAPLNQSSVYFSTDNYINLAAINVTWNFMHSLSHHLGSSENPYASIPAPEAKGITDSLFLQSSEAEKLVDLTATSNPNIILIVWESFTKKAIDTVKNGVEITPGFNKLKKEGVYFTDIYATGDRTDKGIVGVLSGYPSQPITSIIKIPQKAAKLPKLPLLYAGKGYQTSFYYGGELEFANMKAYLLGCGFHDYTSKYDFDSKDQNSKWGAHDGVVKDRLIKDLTKKKSPYFSTWLTLSSHEPYETPVKTVIPGKDDESMFLNSIHYADSSIYDFIKQMKQTPEWKNTVVVIVADHGHRLPRTRNKIDDYKIPVLWLGGALVKKGVEINHIGSQTDIAATLLSQTGITPNPFTWSKNLLANEINQWAYFAFNNGFGFVLPGRYFIYDNVGKSVMEQSGPVTDSDIRKGKAMQQESFADYLEK
jgi:phosphoglycerol transferase MdoB-like AlkP superfamily enzyme